MMSDERFNPLFTEKCAVCGNRERYCFLPNFFSLGNGILKYLLVDERFATIEGYMEFVTSGILTDKAERLVNVFC